MRKRIIPTLLLLLVFSLSITSCDLIDKFPGLGNEDKIPTQGGGLNDGTDEHTHQFTEKNKADIYLKSPATCTEPSIYYYSCSCSERGIDAFVDGEALGHVFNGGDCDEPMICSVCGVKDSRPRGHIWESADEWTIVCTSCGLVVNTNDHTHTWTMADCLLPKTCSVCGATEGEALGHNWKEADCTRPKTCLSCGITEGELGNHNYVNKTCTNCGVSEPATYTQYSIKVASKGGLPLSGVTVYVHSGEGYSLCAVPAVSDKNGVVSFELEISDEYSIELSDAPLGYEVKSGQTKSDRYAVTSTETVIALTSAPIAEGGFKSSYSLGDVMYDFTLTDVNGKSYKLSELLMTKDMVMLNFWFVNCIYCEYEFPYINSAYMKYKDSVEILAVNNYDSVTGIKAFAESFAVPLAMPMIREGSGVDDLTLSRFPSHGYPTTVVIDRYGVVCLIEIGAVIGEDKWKNMFEHFVGEDYEQMLFTDDSIFNR